MAGVFCQLFHDALTEAAVFDAVIQAAEHAGRVGNGFLFADLGAGRVEISNVHAEVVRGHLKGAARAGRGLSGSMEAFVDLMNQTAKELGCTDSHFVMKRAAGREIALNVDEGLGRHGVGLHSEGLLELDGRDGLGEGQRALTLP